MISLLIIYAGAGVAAASAAQRRLVREMARTEIEDRRRGLERRGGYSLDVELLEVAFALIFWPFYLGGRGILALGRAWQAQVDAAMARERARLEAGLQGETGPIPIGIVSGEQGPYRDPPPLFKCLACGSLSPRRSPGARRALPPGSPPAAIPPPTSIPGSGRVHEAHGPAGTIKLPMMRPPAHKAGAKKGDD